MGQANPTECLLPRVKSQPTEGSAWPDGEPPWTVDHGDTVYTSGQVCVLAVAYNYMLPSGYNNNAVTADHPCGFAKWRESLEAPQARAWSRLRAPPSPELPPKQATRSPSRARMVEGLPSTTHPPPAKAANKASAWAATEPQCKPKGKGGDGSTGGAGKGGGAGQGSGKGKACSKPGGNVSKGGAMSWGSGKKGKDSKTAAKGKGL